MSVNVTFRGVRGSTPCCSADYNIYGGNTACVELDFDGKIVVLDAGTGIRALGNDLIRRKVPHVDLLISHAHWDHISGFPFFRPLYRQDCALDVYACLLSDGRSIKNALETQMSSPFFPLPMSKIPSSLHFNDIECGDSFTLCGGAVRVKTLPLNHPNGATGFRLEYDGTVIAYISDTEHFADKCDENVIALARGADLMIYDAMFTQAEYPTFTGWGHSTEEEAIGVTRAASVKRTALFHHSPEHTDADMMKIDHAVRAEQPNVFCAKENMRLTL